MGLFMVIDGWDLVFFLFEFFFIPFSLKFVLFFFCPFSYCSKWVFERSDFF